MRVRLAFVAAAAVLVLAGCGGGDGAGGDVAKVDESAAGLVPAGAPVFAAFNTDFSSSQLEAADELLQKFPIRERALRELREYASEAGVDLDALKESAGPEVDVAILDVTRHTLVGFARPSDSAAFVRQLEAQDPPLAHTTSGEWTLFARDEAALRAVKAADAKLKDSEKYKEAIAELPGEAIAKVYADGAGLQSAVGNSGLPGGSSLGGTKTEWASAAVSAHDDGLELQAHTKGDTGESVKNVDPALADLIPSGSVAALSFTGLAPVLREVGKAGIPFVGGLERALQVPLVDVIDAVGGPSILYVRPSTIIPEVTFVVDPKDEDKALSVLDRIATRLSEGQAPRRTTVDGTEVREVKVGGLSVFYGVVDGKVVVTDSSAAFKAVAEGPSKTLADDDVFADASDAAGMPDDTNGWLYLNLKDGVPLVESLARLGNAEVPPDVEQNLEPLRSALVYGSREGGVQTIVAFVQTS